MFPVLFLERLAEAKRAAQALGNNGADHAVTVGGEEFLIAPNGGKATSYILRNDDVTLEVRPSGTDSTLGVKFTAAGLWEHGLPALQDRVRLMLMREAIRTRKAPTISTCHYAVDFYSPNFTAEMVPGLQSNVIMPSGCKAKEDGHVRTHGNRARIETMTIGSKSTLEIQVYDKGREIREASGKEWMVELWQREGYHPPDDGPHRHIWRIETRFGKEWLRNRGVLTGADFHRLFPKLISEALNSRRLTVPKAGDCNARRWPMHPLWAEALAVAQAARAYAPLGRRFSMRRVELAALLKQQAHGVARAYSHLMVRKYDRATVEDLAADMPDALDAAPNGRTKDVELTFRYKLIEEAR